MSPDGELLMFPGRLRKVRVHSDARLAELSRGLPARTGWRIIVDELIERRAQVERLQSLLLAEARAKVDHSHLMSQMDLLRP